MATTLEQRQQQLDQIRRVRATGAEEIDRRGRTKFRSLDDLNRIEADLVREVDAETNPGRVRTRRVVVTPRSGF